jgi:hypothetical protein
MIFSLNEVEAMGKRAARGAGRDWGIAEEAGKAARWLTAHNLPGPELLAELLTRNEGLSYDELVPISTDGVWQAKSGRLCPLIAGAALSDRAAEVAAGRAFEFGSIAFSPDGGLAVEGDMAAVTTPTTKSAHCRSGRKDTVTPPARQPGRAVEAKAWNRLSAFAHRTFAPATEASRLAGAGASLTDND